MLSLRWGRFRGEVFNVVLFVVVLNLGFSERLGVIIFV